MRTLWAAGVVFLLGALATAELRDAQTGLMLAAIGFGLVYAAESNFDWKMRLTRRDAPQQLSERRFKTTIVGKLAEWLGLLSMLVWFVLEYR